MWAWPAEIILIWLGCAAGGRRGQDMLLSEIEGEFKQNFIAAYLHYAARNRFLNFSHKRPQNSSLHYPPPPRHHSLRRQVSHKKHKTGLAVEICPVGGGGWGGGKQLKLCNRNTLAAHTHHWDWQCIWNWVGKKTKEAEEGEGRGQKENKLKTHKLKLSQRMAANASRCYRCCCRCCCCHAPTISVKWTGSDMAARTCKRRTSVFTCKIAAIPEWFPLSFFIPANHRSRRLFCGFVAREYVCYRRKRAWQITEITYIYMLSLISGKLVAIG